MDAEMHKADDYGKDVSAAYRQAARSMQADIEKWCAKFAENNGISMAEARKVLKKDELEEFHWTVEEYIKHGEENGISADWTKQLVNASTRVHINRLEALQMQCYEHAHEATDDLKSGLHDTLSSIYEDTYYHTAYEVQKAAGHGVPFAKIDTAQVDKILSKPWAADGADFSERIWKNRTQLLQELNAGLTQGIIRGDPPDKMVQHLSKRFAVSESRAQTLVQTESTFFANQAQADNFAELGVEKYEIVAALDSTTCETCAAMDGKQFPLKEEAAGINAPPFHARCRCCKAPVVEDEAPGERAARGEDGKTYYVPENMTYDEWKAQDVDNASEKSDVVSSGKSDIIKEKIRTAGKLPKTAKIHFPPAPVDMDLLSFDDKHINSERGHEVTREQAIQWIHDAKISVSVWGGRFERYYGTQGTVYVNTLNNLIRTAYAKDEYDDNTRAILEVIKKYAL